MGIPVGIPEHRCATRRQRCDTWENSSDALPLRRPRTWQEAPRKTTSARPTAGSSSRCTPTRRSSAARTRQKATEAFREVQAAYECLYDEQERAYYDANRDAILRGEDPDDYEVEKPPQQKKRRGRAKRDPEDVWDAFEAELWPFFSREAFWSSMIEKANRSSSRRTLDKNDSAYTVGGSPGGPKPRAVPKLFVGAPRALLRASRDDDDDHAAGLLPLLPRRLRARQRGRAFGIAGERRCL